MVARRIASLIFLIVAANVAESQWVRTDCPGVSWPQSMYANGATVFEATNVFMRSTDNGESWADASTGIEQQRILCMATIGNTLLAGTMSAGMIYLSTDNGARWTRTWGGVPGKVNGLAASGSDVFATTFGDNGIGVLRSTNSGRDWSGDLSGAHGTPTLLFAANGNLFVPFITDFAARIMQLMRSTDRGSSFSAADGGLPTLGNPAYPWDMTTMGTSIFLATDSAGVFRSTNNGTSWTAVNNGLSNIAAWSFAVFGSNIFVVTRDGVFLSNNSGNSWRAVNEGLPMQRNYAYKITANNKYLFMGAQDGSVWRRPLSDMGISGVNDQHGTPTRFELRQNYPNPFNPSTNISFSLPSNTFVTLKVFDALGREVSILAGEELAAGRYSRHWNAASVPSGVYFYRLQAGAYTESKKMVLLR